MFRSCLGRSVCCVLVCSMALSATANAQDFDVDSLQERIYKTIDNVKPAVVSIGQRGSAFSGVIVSKEGHILSAAHAVRPGSRYRVSLPDGRRFTARGKGSNPQADCALLQITDQVDDLPYIPMGESKSLVDNQPCLSLSFPGGQRPQAVPVVRFGHVLRSGRNRRGMLQSTALMEPGDSGGALVDLQGRVIGIHSRIGLSMTRNLEVPVDTFKKYWSELNREQSFTESGPPVPILGFQGRGRRDGTGIDVFGIVDGSLADKHGLQPKDVIQTVYGEETPSIQRLRRALIAARDDDEQEIIVKVLREVEGDNGEDEDDDGDEEREKEIELKVPFDVERKSAPKVELPDYGEKEYSKPTGIEELADLPAEFSELESKLDDACVEISSKLSDGEKLSIVGTRIKGTSFIVSKSSMVAGKPMFKFEDSTVKLEVVKRDTENDLVLLKSEALNATGIDISNPSSEVPDIGSFLITPDSDGAGLVSIVSTKTFTSRKQQSRGFLGVMPADYKDRGGAILRQVTEGGAAERAGLKVGDIVTRLNEAKITSHMEMRRFLGSADPNATVVATITRDDEELEKTILLGTAPSRSNHAADRMSKSARRDGFSKVIPHDADLQPTECGSPIFDLDGNFVGLNIARNSRVRSYAIPSSIVKKLIAEHP